MIPFIPNDKHDISALENCWKYVKKNMSNIDNLYFSELANKTYELFLNYNQEESIPKELVALICVLAQFEIVGEYEKYSASDIIKEIVVSLLSGLSNGFKLTKNTKNENAEFNDTVFGISYNDDWYQLDAKTFDITPILNKQHIKI